MTACGVYCAGCRNRILTLTAHVTDANFAGVESSRPSRSWIMLVKVRYLHHGLLNLRLKWPCGTDLCGSVRVCLHAHPTLPQPCLYRARRRHEHMRGRFSDVRFGSMLTWLAPVRRPELQTCRHVCVCASSRCSFVTASEKQWSCTRTLRMSQEGGPARTDAPLTPHCIRTLGPVPHHGDAWRCW